MLAVYNTYHVICYIIRIAPSIGFVRALPSAYVKGSTGFSLYIITDHVCLSLSASIADKDKVIALFKSKTQQEWIDFNATEDVCIEPVLTVDELFTHPQHVDRQVFPEAPGCQRQVVLGPRLSAHAPSFLSPAPTPGQHSREILFESGFSNEEIERFIANKLV